MFHHGESELQRAKTGHPKLCISTNVPDTGFSFYAMELKAGSRLRMVITSPNFPGLQKIGIPVAKWQKKRPKSPEPRWSNCTWGQMRRVLCGWGLGWIEMVAVLLQGWALPTDSQQKPLLQRHPFEEASAPPIGISGARCLDEVVRVM